jgi:hypothetical protein
VTNFDKVIPPGSEGKVHASIDISHIKGLVEKAVDVETNDPALPHTKLSIKANVKTYFDMRPTENLRFTVTKGKAETKELIIVPTYEKPVKLLTPTINNPDAFDIRLDPPPAGTKDYKLLNIATTATPARLAGSVVTMSTQAIISPAGAGNNVVRVPPTIAWSGSSPSTDSIVYGTSVQVGGSADAVGTGVIVTNMNLYCDGSLLQNWSGSAAQYTFTTASGSCDFYWNSQAKDASNTPFWEDGSRTLKLEAWDSNGQQNYITRSVLVDNHAPIEPASVTVTDTTAATTLTHVITWPVCADGTSPAYRYSIAIYRQPPSATSSGTYTDWTSVPALSASSNTVSRNPQQSFGRYLYAVDSVSPRGLTLSAPATGIAITRPTITGARALTSSGSGSNKKWTLTTAVSMGAPNFPYDSAATSNTLYHATSASGPWTQVGSPTSSFTLPNDGYTMSSTLFSYYYKVVTVITPRGYAGGSPVTLTSNVIGPTGTTVGSGSMTNVGW